MTLTARRPHWKVGRRKGEYEEPDPKAKRYQCFTVTAHAVEWWIEQLAARTVEELGGFEAAADAHDWMERQASWDDEINPEEYYIHSSGWTRSAEIGGIEYVIQLCACTGDVIGRCDNIGCDRETDFDTEPYPGTMYTRWSNECYRCYYPERANGGFTGRDQRPVPKHRHLPDTEGQVSKLIENDEWVGWRCRETVADDGTECGLLWRFAHQDEWASTHRLTRMWDGKVTGTEGYVLTEAEAIAESQRLTLAAAERGSGYTVGYEAVTKVKENNE